MRAEKPPVSSQRGRSPFLDRPSGHPPQACTPARRGGHQLHIGPNESRPAGQPRQHSSSSVLSQSNPPQNREMPLHAGPNRVGTPVQAWSRLDARKDIGLSSQRMRGTPVFYPARALWGAGGPGSMQRDASRDTNVWYAWHSPWFGRVREWKP